MGYGAVHLARDCRTPRPGLIALSTLVGMSLLATSSTGSTAAPPQTSAALVGAANGAIAWTACGEQLECAKVRVPLNWEHPRGGKIKLAVIRHRASRPEERIGSMFVNPGGPGGSVEQVREEGASLDAAGQGRFDVVGWDIRGAGDSTHVRCFRGEKRRARFFANWSIPTPGRQSRRIAHKTATLARRCGEVSGRLLRHISAADTARDLDHLRRLVGDRKLTYVGISAGTFIGQTYANMFPRRVRAMVLDGVVDPVAYTRGTEAGYANQLRFSDRGFEGFLSLCESAGPAGCALAGDGPVAPRVDQMLAQLRRGSIPAPSADPPGELTYGDALSAIIVEMSAGPATWPDLAAQLDAAASGDGSALATAGRLLTTAFSSQDVRSRSAWRRTHVRGQPRPGRPRGVAGRSRSALARQLQLRTGAHLVALGALCLMARAQRRSLHRAMGRLDEEPDPGHRHPLRPEHAVRERSPHRAPARQRGPADP